MCFKYVREYTPTIRVQQLIVVLKTVNNNRSLVTTACKATEFTNTHIFYNITNFIILSIISSTSGSAVSVVQTGCFVGLGGVSVILTASLIGNIVLVVTIGCILMRKHPLDQNK